MKNGTGAKTLNWIETGSRENSTVILIHPVGLDLTYWERQIEALRPSYHVVAYDLPGHGRSPGGPEDCGFKAQVNTVARLIGEVSEGPVHLVGISFGGMIAQATVLERPELIRSLTLLGTASRFSSETRAGMRSRAQATRAGGMSAVLQPAMERWFTRETRAARTELIDRVSKTLLGDDPAVHAAVWDAIADEFDVSARLGEIRCPTLILVGEMDPSTPPSASAAMAEAIGGSKMVIVPAASHMLMLEEPDAVNAEMQSFLLAGKARGALLRDNAQQE